MKFHSIFSSAVIVAGVFLSLSSSPAQAETVFYPNYALRSHGIDMHTTEIVGLSPDNRLLCCLQRFKPVRGQKSVNTFYIIPVSSTGNLGDVRAFPLEGVGKIGQISFTPDSNAILFTTFEGTKLTKMDCKTGEMTTLMEHVEGKPGFVISPQIMRMSDDKLLTMGYHYNSEDFVGPQAVVRIDPDQTGLKAFVDCHLIDHVQQAVYSNREYPGTRQGYPSFDTGYIIGIDLNNNVCDVFSWDGERGTIKLVEDCHGFEDAVCGGTRFVYSVQDEDGTYRLCVYDIKSDEKTVLASGREKPCYYTLMSDDGNTLTFNERTGDAEKYTTFYARASEGWEINPIEGLEKRQSFGRERLSSDGKYMVFHNDDGLRIVELKAPRK